MGKHRFLIVCGWKQKISFHSHFHLLVYWVLDFETGNFTETELGEVNFPEISTPILEKVCQYFYWSLQFARWESSFYSTRTILDHTIVEHPLKMTPWHVLFFLESWARIEHMGASQSQCVIVFSSESFSIDGIPLILAWLCSTVKNWLGTDFKRCHATATHSRISIFSVPIPKPP